MAGLDSHVRRDQKRREKADPKLADQLPRRAWIRELQAGSQFPGVAAADDREVREDLLLREPAPVIRDPKGAGGRVYRQIDARMVVRLRSLDDAANARVVRVLD